MSIYIPGMGMPDGCEGCFFLLDCGICSMLMAVDCEHKTVGDYRWEENERHPECPLFEVPQHGRLIDADELEPDENWSVTEDGFISFSQFAINNANTIIPEERGKHEA